MRANALTCSVFWWVSDGQICMWLSFYRLTARRIFTAFSNSPQDSWPKSAQAPCWCKNTKKYKIIRQLLHSKLKGKRERTIVSMWFVTVCGPADFILSTRQQFSCELCFLFQCLPTSVLFLSETLVGFEVDTKCHLSAAVCSRHVLKAVSLNKAGKLSVPCVMLGFSYLCALPWQAEGHLLVIRSNFIHKVLVISW